MVLFVTQDYSEQKKNESHLSLNKDDIVAESQKGINAVQRCSAANQKGAIAVQSLR